VRRWWIWRFRKHAGRAIRVHGGLTVASSFCSLASDDTSWSSVSWVLLGGWVGSAGSSGFGCLDAPEIGPVVGTLAILGVMRLRAVDGIKLAIFQIWLADMYQAAGLPDGECCQFSRRGVRAQSQPSSSSTVMRGQQYVWGRLRWSCRRNQSHDGLVIYCATHIRLADCG
jgi:hypothetical protein